MTHADAFFAFHNAMNMVSDEAIARYQFWANTFFDDNFNVPFNTQRLEWCMSDPEWSEAILLVRLGGK